MNSRSVQEKKKQNRVSGFTLNLGVKQVQLEKARRLQNLDSSS